MDPEEIDKQIDATKGIVERPENIEDIDGVGTFETFGGSGKVDDEDSTDGEKETSHRSRGIVNWIEKHATIAATGVHNRVRYPITDRVFSLFVLVTAAVGVLAATGYLLSVMGMDEGAIWDARVAIRDGILLSMDMLYDGLEYLVYNKGITAAVAGVAVYVLYRMEALGFGSGGGPG